MSYLSVTHWASGVCFLVWFFSVKAVCCLNLYTAGRWGLWHKARSLWLKQLIWTFKVIASEHERNVEVRIVNVGFSRFSSQNPGNLFCYKILALSKEHSQGYLSAVSGLIACVVLRIHLSSPNKSPLPLDHLVTVHDIIDLFSFICVP